MQRDFQPGLPAALRRHAQLQHVCGYAYQSFLFRMFNSNVGGIGRLSLNFDATEFFDDLLESGLFFGRQLSTATEVRSSLPTFFCALVKREGIRIPQRLCAEGLRPAPVP
jgi:hypothetical protein